MNVEILVVFK